VFLILKAICNDWFIMVCCDVRHNCVRVSWSRWFWLKIKKSSKWITEWNKINTFERMLMLFSTWLFFLNKSHGIVVSVFWIIIRNNYNVIYIINLTVQIWKGQQVFSPNGMENSVMKYSHLLKNNLRKIWLKCVHHLHMKSTWWNCLHFLFLNMNMCFFLYCKGSDSLKKV